MKDFWFKFEPARWELDMRFVSPEGRCLWFQMIIEMWRSPRQGYLLQPNCQPFATSLLAVCCNMSPTVVEKAIAELESFSVFSRDENGIIFCRKIARDALLREKRQLSGKKGGIAKSFARPVARVLPESLPAFCYDRDRDRDRDIIDTNVSIPASANADPQVSSLSVKKPARKPREPDAVWDVVAELYFGNNVVLDSQKKKCGMIVRDLKKLGATPDEIRRRKANIPESWTMPGPTALVGHWSELDKPQTKGTQNGPRIEKSGPNGFTRIQEEIDLSCIIRR